MIPMMTRKEHVFRQCARMILYDQCPPDRKHYLCMKQEDDTGACTQCWENYLWGLAKGDIELPSEIQRRAAI